MNACVDNENSPHAPAGRAMSGVVHAVPGLPVRAGATPTSSPSRSWCIDQLVDRKAAMTPLAWTQRFALPHAQLTDLLGQHDADDLAAARASITDADRDTVEQFLNRHLDYPMSVDAHHERHRHRPAWRCRAPHRRHTGAAASRSWSRAPTRAHSVRFGQDRWHVNEGIFEEDAAPYSFSFTAIPAPFRGFAKHYLWQVINHDAPSPMRGPPPNVLPCGPSPTCGCPSRYSWSGCTSAASPRSTRSHAELLDDYLIEVGARATSTLGLQVSTHHRGPATMDLSARCSPTTMRLPTMPPWGGDAARELFGNGQSHAGEPDAPDRRRHHGRPAVVVTALRRRLRQRHPGRSSRVPVLALPQSTGTANPRTSHLPRQGRDRSTHGGLHRQTSARKRFTARKFGARRTASHRLVPHRRSSSTVPSTDGRPDSRAAQLLLNSGLPIADDAYLDTPITAQLDDAPWHDGPDPVYRRATPGATPEHRLPGRHRLPVRCPARGSSQLAARLHRARRHQRHVADVRGVLQERGR